MMMMMGTGTGMSDDTPNDQCSHQVMCCDGQPNVCPSISGISLWDWFGGGESMVYDVM